MKEWGGPEGFTEEYLRSQEMPPPKEYFVHCDDCGFHADEQKIHNAIELKCIHQRFHRGHKVYVAESKNLLDDNEKENR